MQARFYGAPEPSQFFVTDTGFIEMAECAFQIFWVLARLPLTMRDEIDLPVKIERTGILMMFTVDDKTQCLDALQAIVEHHICYAFHIDRRDLVARLQIGPCSGGCAASTRKATPREEPPDPDEHSPGARRSR